MNIEDDNDEVRVVLICEVCSYENHSPEVFYSWSRLIQHARKTHWNLVGRAGNGQPKYLCQHCGVQFQMSDYPVIDFAANIYCSVMCGRAAYDARIDTLRTFSLIEQERRDEDYVMRSLKGEV